VHTHAPRSRDGAERSSRKPRQPVERRLQEGRARPTHAAPLSAGLVPRELLERARPRRTCSPCPDPRRRRLQRREPGVQRGEALPSRPGSLTSLARPHASGRAGPSRAERTGVPHLTRPAQRPLISSRPLLAPPPPRGQSPANPPRGPAPAPGRGIPSPRPLPTTPPAAPPAPDSRLPPSNLSN
jgi:hypothetical protein